MSDSEAGFVSKTISFSTHTVWTALLLGTGSCLHASSNASYGLPVVEFEVPERSVKTLPSATRDISLTEICRTPSLLLRYFTV